MQTMLDSKITSFLSDYPEFQDRLARLKKEYDIADQLSRDVQSFVQKAGVPAINELRYAGHHLLSSLTEPETTPEFELDRAIAHCQRASYDASEAGLFVAFKKVQKFKDDYANFPITGVVSDWVEILEKCDAANAAITSSRARGDDRGSDYTKHKETFRELVTLCGRLDHARIELNKLIQDKVDSARATIKSLQIAAAGVVVGLLGIAVAIYLN